MSIHSRAFLYALRCGPVSVPTHKLIPDTRWVLDLGQADVVARSDPSQASQRKARYGVAIFPVGRTNILRTGFAVNTDAITQVPAAGFSRIATEKYFAAYVRCPPGSAWVVAPPGALTDGTGARGRPAKTLLPWLSWILSIHLTSRIRQGRRLEG